MSPRVLVLASIFAECRASIGRPAHWVRTMLAASSSFEQRSSRNAARAVRTSPRWCHGRVGGIAVVTGSSCDRRRGASCAIRSWAWRRPT
eukprot:scaffold121877_cov34-Tisochrysis_lutea.AAC.4